MKKLAVMITLFCSLAGAQIYQPINGWCQLGGKGVAAPATLGGTPIQQFVQESYKGCTITVFQHGTTTPVQLYSTGLGTSLSNPFQASTQTGFFQAYASTGLYDIQESGNVSPAVSLGTVSIPPFLSVVDFGATGNGTTDDSAAIQRAVNAAGGAVLTFPPGVYRVTVSILVPPSETLNLGGASIFLDQTAYGGAPLILGVGDNLVNGTIYWTSGAQYFDALIPSDDCTIKDIRFIGSGATTTTDPILGEPVLYQRAIVWGGSALIFPQTGTKTSPRPNSPTTSNRVSILNCYFTEMTVGIWAGGSSSDTVPYSWKILHSRFENIVGSPGLSSGYAIDLTPASYSIVADNSFFTIERHAIYVVGGSSYNDIHDNIINTVDNEALIVYSFGSQPPSNYNHIHGNTISNITKNFPYGFTSAVGIGVHVDSSHTLVEDNTVIGASEIGIYVVGTNSNPPPNIIGTDNQIVGNKIYPPTSGGFAGIQFDNPDGFVMANNTITINNGASCMNNASTPGYTPINVSVFISNVCIGVSDTTIGFETNSVGIAHEVSLNNYVHITTSVDDGGSGIDYNLDLGAGFMKARYYQATNAGGGSSYSPSFLAGGMSLDSAYSNYSGWRAGIQAVAGALQFSTGTSNVASMLTQEGGVLSFYAQTSTGLGNPAAPTNYFAVSPSAAGFAVPVSVTGSINSTLGYTIGGSTVIDSTNHPFFSGGSTGKAVCWKTLGGLGFCSTQPDSTGACTCN